MTDLLKNCDPRIRPSKDGLTVVYSCACGYETDILGGSPLVLDIMSLDRKHHAAVRQQREAGHGG